MLILVTVDVDPTLYSQEYLDQERRALGEDRYKREFLGIPAGGQVSPFIWEQFDRAALAPVHPATWKGFRPTIIAHDVGHTKDRSTAVVGGKNIYAPGLTLLKEFEELPQGLYGSDRAEALARIDRLYDYKTLIFADLSFDPTYAEILVERLGPERVIGLKITNSGDGMSFEPFGASKTAQSASIPLAEAICSIFCTANCTTIKFASLMERLPAALMSSSWRLKLIIDKME